jgi:hypothetical protein
MERWGQEFLKQALSYSNIVFGGSVSLWFLGSLTGIVRGMGDMKSAARICGFPGGRRVAAISNPDIWVGTDSEVRNSWCRNSDADLLHFRYHRNGGASAIRPKPGSFHVTLSSLRLQWRLFYRILTVASL